MQVMLDNMSAFQWIMMFLILYAIGTLIYIRGTESGAHITWRVLWWTIKIPLMFVVGFIGFALLVGNNRK